MAGNVITQKDLDQIKNEISTNCAIYTDQVQFGVEIALKEVCKLIVKESEMVDWGVIE